MHEELIAAQEAKSHSSPIRENLLTSSSEK